MSSRYDEIASNLERVREQVKSAAESSDRKYEDITVIAVTKTFPISDVHILASLDDHHYGENRDSEGSLKAAEVPGTWHFQGQIQSNKLKSICSWADVIQTIDTTRYVELVSKAAQKDIEVFIQVSLDGRTHRGGALPSDLNEIADSVLATKNLKLQGLMAVAPLGEDPNQAFQRLSKIHSDFKERYPSAPYLSAGMSGDYLSAISHGATHVRVGSSILGSRN